MSLLATAPPALTIGIIVIAALAAWSDLATRRIPNILTVGALLLAILLRLPLGGDAVLSGLAGAAIAFAVIFPLFALGGFGGGDAKLLTAMGAFLGLEGLVPGLFAIGMIGMAMSIIVSVRRAALLGVLANTFGLMKRLALLPLALFHPFQPARIAGERPAPSSLWPERDSGRSPQRGSGRTMPSESVTVPYAVAIGIGAVLGHLYGGLS
jgi:Flp pilus assembly protein protease CpaA